MNPLIVVLTVVSGLFANAVFAFASEPVIGPRIVASGLLEKEVAVGFDGKSSSIYFLMINSRTLRLEFDSEPEEEFEGDIDYFVRGVLKRDQFGLLKLASADIEPVRTSSKSPSIVSRILKRPPNNLEATTSWMRFQYDRTRLAARKSGGIQTADGLVRMERPKELENLRGYFKVHGVLETEKPAYHRVETEDPDDPTVKYKTVINDHAPFCIERDATTNDQLVWFEPVK